MSTVFRPLVNRPGVTYDEDDTKRLYAEDMAQIHQAVNLLESKTCDSVSLGDVAAETAYADFANVTEAGLYRASWYGYVNPSAAGAGGVRLRFRAYTGVMFHEEVSATLSLTGLNQVAGMSVIFRASNTIRYKVELVSGAFSTAKANFVVTLEKIG